MFNTYPTIADVLASPLANIGLSAPQELRSDRVLKSTRLEDAIYTDLRHDDVALDELEQAAAEKLKTFPTLSRDVYQSFYALSPRHQEEENLSTTARKLNRHILDHVMEGEDYPTIKSICEGRELPAYEAAGEFVLQVSENLDSLLADAGGEKGALNTLEKLESAKEQAQQELSDLMERMQGAQGKNETLEQAALSAANRLDSKSRQADAVGKLVDTSLARHQASIGELLAKATQCAKEKAEEVQSIVVAWSDEPGNLEHCLLNTALLERVRQSKALLDISKYLGRFREIFAQGKKNGYAYGRGEKYSLELGGDLRRATTSELAMLAAPATLPLFLRKVQRKQIKQYCRREPIHKGMGDIIVCLDESGSTAGDPAAWGKAVAMALLEIAAESGRSFALVHFSGAGSYKTDVFQPGAYSVEDKLVAAETFLGGGTNFETPMLEALRLMEEEDFQTADVVFVTDGACAVSEDFVERLRSEQAQRQFSITGVLLDADSPGMDFSLKSFCQNIYRTSELTGDAVVSALVASRV